MGTTTKNRSLMAGLLEDPAVTETPNPAARTAPRPARVDTRLSSLSRVTSSDQKEKTFFLVDPERCRMWKRHNRRYELLNEHSCSEVLEGFRAQGEQEFPAIVRRVVDDPNVDFEVICGARRHWCVTFLRNVEHRPIKFLIEVRDLDDEQAFRLADIENRSRKDISDYERATDYLEAIDAYYGGVAQRMAERLDVNRAWLSRFLDLAKLPAAVVEAFGDVRELRENHARVIKPLLADENSRKRVLAEASRISRTQTERQGRGEPCHPAASVIIALKKVAKGEAAPAAKAEPETVTTSRGVKMFTIARKGDNRAVVELILDSKASNEEFLSAFKDALERLRT